MFVNNKEQSKKDNPLSDVTNLRKKAYIRKFPRKNKSKIIENDLLSGCTFIVPNILLFSELSKYKTNFNVVNDSKAIKNKADGQIYLLDFNHTEERAVILKKQCFKSNIIYLCTKALTALLEDEQGAKFKASMLLNDIERCLLFLVGSNGSVKGFNDDMRLMSVSHCITVNFNQYLGQDTMNEYGIIPKLQLEEAVSRHKKIVIAANAGTGKGYVMRELVHSLGRVNEARFIIYVFPTNSITDQQTNDFDNYLPNKEVLKLDGRTKRKSVEEFLLNEGRVILSTFDSLVKIEDFTTNGDVIGESILVVDEYHSLVSDYDFRDRKNFSTVLSYMSRAMKTVLCSATPELIFCESEKLNRHFGYTLIVGNEKLTNEITLKNCVYNTKEGRASVVSKIHELYTQKDKTVLFKLDKKEALKSMILGYRDMGISIEGFWSGDGEKQKHNNKNYTSVCESGILKDSVNWLCFTTLLEAGVSLKFDCSCLVIADNTTATRLVQLATRARFNAKTGINKRLDVILCTSDAKKDNLKGYRGGCYVQHFFSKFSEWQKFKNNSLIGSKSVKTKADQQEFDLILGDELESEVSILGLLHVINKRLDKISIGELFKRVQRLDSRFKIGANIDSNCSQLDEIKNRAENLKADRKTREQKAKLAALADFRTMCDLVAFNTKDNERKERIRKAFNIKFPDKVKALEFGEKYPSIIDCKFANRIIKSVMEIKESCKEVSKSMDTNRALELTLSLAKSDIKGIVSTLNHKIRKKNVKEGTAKTVDVLEDYKVKQIKKAIGKVIKNVKHGRVKEFQLIEYYQKVINKSISTIETDSGIIKVRSLTKAKAKEILLDIFFVEKGTMKVKGKRVTKYKIIEVKQIKKALEML